MRPDTSTPSGSYGRNNGPLPRGAKIGATYKGIVTVIRVYYSSSDFAAVRVREDGGVEFSAVGRGTLSGIQPGARIETSGVWVRSRYGLQVDFGNVSILSVDDSMGYLESLISHCPRAERDLLEPILRRIHEIYGEGMEEAIREGSALVDTACNVGRHAIRITRLSQEKREKDARMATLARIHQFGINSMTAELLMCAYGHDAPDVISTFPYEVAMEIPGISIRLADNIARRSDLVYDPDLRMRLLIAYAMEVAMNDGHCYIPRSSFLTGTANLIDRMDDHIEYDPSELRESVVRAVRVCDESKMLVIDTEDRVYPYECHEAEDTISRNVVIRMESPLTMRRNRLPLLPSDTNEISNMISLVSDIDDIEYSPMQLDAVRSAMVNPISILSGGPGTGKTTTCRAIVDVFEESGMRCLLCSPTGRGARRLSESVGREASTIHRLLEFLPQTGEWRRNSLNQLACDAVIVDEMSMVDILLFKALLDAMPGVGRIVLVGDHDQLPSVGPGRVLRDLMECGTIPVTILDTIFRQADGNDIVAVAHQVKYGVIPEIPLLPDDPATHGCWLVDEANPESLRRRIHELMISISGRTNCLPSDIQVLSPMRKGVLGTEVLNIQLQDELNPPRRGVKDCRYRGFIFRTGDKVMQIRNDHVNEVFNGDMGIVSSSGSDGVTIRFDGGQEIRYVGSMMEGIEHAYAITCHKSQGSEFPVGIILMHPMHSRMLRRNLFYTAITRCTDEAVVLGRMSSVIQAIEDNREQARCTSLSDRIRDFNQAVRR